LCKDPNSNSFAAFEVEVWTTDTADMAFCSSLVNEILSVAIEQSSSEDVLAASILVAGVLVLADDCPQCKYYIIWVLISYEKIKNSLTQKQKTPKNNTL
jgi:hypothetical protein